MNFKSACCWGLTAYLTGTLVLGPLFEELADTPFDQPHNEQPDYSPPMFRFAPVAQLGTAGTGVVLPMERSVVPGDVAKGAPDFETWRRLNSKFEKITLYKLH